MKKKKILKIVSIVLSIIIIIIDICIYLKMRKIWIEVGNYHPYENAGLIISGLFMYSILIWGIILIPMVWIEYFLINLLDKIYKKYNDIKKYFLSLLVLITIIIILIFFIRILFMLIKILFV